MIEKTLLRQLDGQAQLTISMTEGELIRLQRAAELMGGDAERYVRQAVVSMLELDEDDQQWRSRGKSPRIN